eukprot:scaffold4253_cov178-Chaetoceros_neogracile.AAC.1
MMVLINKIKPEPRNDPIEIYALPSTDPFAGDEILGNLEGLVPKENKFHTNAGYYLPMHIIDPNYDGLGYGAIAFVNQLDSDPLVHSDVYAYRTNPIPEGNLRGIMGIVGYTSDIDYLRMSTIVKRKISNQSPTLSRSGIESSTAPNYQHASFAMIELLNPNKRIDPEAFKSLLQDDDDTPIGRLNGLAGEPTKFQNDGVYISMDLNEPNFDTIYTSTYMGIIDSVDSQNVNRLAVSRLDYRYRAKSKNESIYGLMGELGTDQSPTLSRSGIESSTAPNYQHASFAMIDLLNPNKRIDPEAFKSLLQDDDDTPIGRLNGLAGEPTKFQNDGVYISMDLNEPNFDTIYTSTYMGIIDSVDSQNVNRLGASRLDYRAKSKNESIYGLMGKLGTDQSPTLSRS